jgi:hypothetical protein
VCVYIEDKNVIVQSLANLLGYIPVNIVIGKTEALWETGSKGELWHKCLGKFYKKRCNAVSI